ncbi:MAG: amidohydrolase [Oligosphaeraceae bacterium]|nr:amidohydrolase [Oligosphaeraceae bacterium]
MDVSQYHIIDAHIHPLAEEKSCRLLLFGQEMSEEEFVSELRAAGIEQTCGSVVKRFPAPPESFREIQALNRAALSFRDRQGDFYIPGVHVHPAFPVESCRELLKMRDEHGVKFVGELVPYMMEFRDCLSPAMLEIFACIQELGLTVNLHLLQESDLPEILRRFPSLKLIVAHPTADPKVYATRLETIAQYPNAALDISGSGPNSWGMLRFGLKTAGPDKIIFGTDFPLRSPGMYVAGVLAEHLSEEERHAIFSGNFRRLLLQ